MNRCGGETIRIMSKWPHSEKDWSLKIWFVSDLYLIFEELLFVKFSSSKWKSDYYVDHNFVSHMEMLWTLPAVFARKSTTEKNTWKKPLLLPLEWYVKSSRIDCGLWISWIWDWFGFTNQNPMYFGCIWFTKEIHEILEIHGIHMIQYFHQVLKIHKRDFGYFLMLSNLFRWYDWNNEWPLLNYFQNNIYWIVKRRSSSGVDVLFRKFGIMISWISWIS